MSFAKAAEELHVTPAALSYQIKSLEERLGMPLFRRLNRAVELTEAGHALQPGLADGFARIVEAVRAVERSREGAALTVTAGPAFTAKWLAPRFFRFASAHPGIELRFVASLRIMDFDRDGIDAAIRFGRPPDARDYSERLIEDWLVPVAAPSLAATLGSAEDVLHAPLVHDDSISFLRPRVDWSAWFATMGLPDRAEAARGPRFSNADHALDVALEGGGVALARASIAERDIRAGRLAMPVPVALEAPGQFHFVCRRGRETDPRIATFLGWLREETASIALLAATVELRHAPP